MANPAVDPQGTPPQGAPQPQGENSAIREVRENYAKLDKDFKAALSELETLKAEKMTESQRLQAERDKAISRVQELEPLGEQIKGLSQQVEAYEGVFKTRYETALNAAPEDKKATLAAITASGSWHDREAALSQALSLIAEPAKIGEAGKPPAGGSPGKASIDPKKFSLSQGVEMSRPQSS